MDFFLCITNDFKALRPSPNKTRKRNINLFLNNSFNLPYFDIYQSLFTEQVLFCWILPDSLHWVVHRAVRTVHSHRTGFVSPSDWVVISDIYQARCENGLTPYIWPYWLQYIINNHGYRFAHKWYLFPPPCNWFPPSSQTYSKTYKNIP